MYNIEIENFQGPLDLLLKLIEKQELDISRISMASIATQYLEYIKTQKILDAEDIGDFLVLAAKLLYIKSKILLPYFSFKEEDEDDIDELEQQLKIYREFLNASKKIEKIFKENNIMYFPNINESSFNILKNKKDYFFPKNIKKEDFSLIYSEILLKLRIERKESILLEKKKINVIISIDDKIDSIKRMLGKKIKFSFDRLLKKANSRSEVIVSFLAILELTKQKVIITSQKDLFTSINISSNDDR